MSGAHRQAARGDSHRRHRLGALALPQPHPPSCREDGLGLSNRLPPGILARALRRGWLPYRFTRSADAIRELSSGTLATCFPDGVAELELFASDEDRSLWATVYSSQPAPSRFGDAWREALPQFESVCWSQTFQGREAVPSLDTVSGSGAVTYRDGEPAGPLPGRLIRGAQPTPR